MRLEQSPNRREVLFGEDFGRSHERYLRPVMDDDERRDDRHDRLPGSHVALKQPPHGERRPKFLGDRGEGSPLGPRQPERQHLPHQLAERVVHGEGVSAGPSDPVLAAAQLEPEGKDEELFQDEPLVAGRTFPIPFRERGAVRGEVHFFECLPPGRQPHPGHQFLGEMTGADRVATIQQPMQDGAQESRGERSDPLVDGHDAAGVRAGRGGDALGRRGWTTGTRGSRTVGAGSWRIGDPVLGDEFVTRVGKLGDGSGERAADLSEQ